ncbi:MAG: Hsp20/alpha crystallin family protein [Deltaproteobacteria bacterium]|nr:Hsp20/alpha crystallin family protein [Deltaproteobacteria bacterium]MBW2355742.1 Hsp20/alpha crystallin family protein [Deltaproteobacteria bacterium]
MAIIRWNPYGRTSMLQERINRMFEETFGLGRTADRDVSMGTWKPKVDVYEGDRGTVIEMELPGVVKDQIEIEVNDNVLTVHGERTAEQQIPETRYYRRERCHGPFRRAFSLPFVVAPADVTARFRDGVLVILITRPASEKPCQVQIPIE